MKKRFFSALVAAAVVFSTPALAMWNPQQKQDFVRECVTRSLSQSKVQQQWPPYLIAQVCDCIAQTFTPFSDFAQFNSMFTDDQTNTQAQQSMYIVATGCVTLVRQQQSTQQMPAPQTPQGWDQLLP